MIDAFRKKAGSHASCDESHRALCAHVATPRRRRGVGGAYLLQSETIGPRALGQYPRGMDSSAYVGHTAKRDSRSGESESSDVSFVSRLFLLDENDCLYRLPNAQFDRMLRGSTQDRIPRFAGARVRKTDVVVERQDRMPVRIVWWTFSIVAFDPDGQLDLPAFERQQRAHVELAVESGLGPSSQVESVVDAVNRFVARGGAWAPSPAILRLIEHVALERMAFFRL